MANEFKVKNGIKFPDNTIQTTAATGGGGSISIGTTPPGSPTAGTLWWDSTYGQLKIYYSDGTSSQWVDANSISSNKFVTTFASPAPIGSTTPNTIAGTTITGTTSVSAPTITGTTVVEATADKTSASTRGAFAYGTLGYSATNALATFQTSVNSYAQIIAQNTNSGASSSADFVVSTNNSTDSTLYGNFGMNSSGWAGTLGTTSLNAPNVTYLSSTGADLVIGTTTSHHIRFVVGGGADIITIDTNGDVGFSVQDPTAQLHIGPGSATAGTAPLKFSSGTKLSTPEVGCFEFDGKTPYFTHESVNRGILNTTQFITLTSNYTTPGGTTALQKLFNNPTNGTLTVSGNTTYFFECNFYLSSMSTTSGTFSFGFLGTAQYSAVSYWAHAKKAAIGASASLMTYGNTASATALVAATTTATGVATITGKLIIGTGGTIIPAFATSVAAASVVNAGASFRIWASGNNTVNEVGNWT